MVHGSGIKQASQGLQIIIIIIIIITITITIIIIIIINRKERK